MSRTTTIKDVAQASGVSVGTVSHVLNNHTDLVSEDKRKRVLQAVRDLGYKPQIGIRGTAAKATRTLGVLLHNSESRSITDHPYFTYVLDGVISAASAGDQSVLVLAEEDSQAILRDIRTRIDGRCDGLALLGTAVSYEAIQILWDRGVPCIQVGLDAGHPEGVVVDCDNVSAAREMTRHLAGLGHRKIAFAGDEPRSYRHEREAGWLSVLQEEGIPTSEAIVIPGDASFSSGRDVADRIMALPAHRRPTAVFCLTDATALGLMERAKEIGLRIPEDISVAGFDGAPGSETSRPSLTTIAQPMKELGKKAVAILNSILDGHEAPKKTLMAGTLVVRGSTAPPRQS